jgi:hypothetical protein
MLQPSNLFTEEIRAYQIYALNYGKCSVCGRTFSQGDGVHVGQLADGNMAVACEHCKGQLSRSLKTYVYHPKEYVVPQKDVLLWRYQDFPKFVSLLNSGELFFTRADNFEDSFEGARGFNFQKDAIYEALKPSLTLKAKSQLIAGGNDYPTDDEVETLVKDEMQALIEQQEQKRQDYYVSCWHANERESEAMWKLYISAKNQGVAIQTTVERLCYSIGKPMYEVGKVKYISYSTPLDVNSTPIWYKRTAFLHENEVRAIFREPGKKVAGLSVQMDLEMLIEKVYISPSASGWFANLVDSVLKKYGLNKKVEHSKLDEKPIY